MGIKLLSIIAIVFGSLWALTRLRRDPNEHGTLSDEWLAAHAYEEGQDGDPL